MLFETKKFWVSTELECQKQYWKIMTNSYPLLQINSERIIIELINLMSQMHDPKLGSCCASPQSINNRFNLILTFVTGLVIKLSSQAGQTIIFEIINFLKNSRCKINHCFLKALIKIISYASDNNEEIKNAHPLLIEICTDFPLDIRLACLELINEKVIPKFDKSSMGVVLKKTLKMFDNLFAEGNIKAKLLHRRKEKVNTNEIKEEEIKDNKSLSDIELEKCNAEDDDNELELAEHCAIAMNRATSNIPFKSRSPIKRNDHELISDRSQQIKQIYSTIMYSLTGEINETKYKEARIINLNTIHLCGIFIKKLSNSKFFHDLMTDIISICGRERENCSKLLENKIFMSSILKMGIYFAPAKSEKFSDKFEQIVQLSAILITHAYYEGKLMIKIIRYFLFPKFKAKTSTFLKILWKHTMLKIINEMKSKQNIEEIKISKIGALYLARSTLQILLLSNKIDPKYLLKISNAFPCSDIELLNLQFEILEFVIWDQDLPNGETIVQIYNEEIGEFGSLNSITILLAIMLGKIVNVKESKEWMRKAKSFTRHLFLLLEKTKENVSIVQNCLEFMVGSLIKKCKGSELTEECHNLFMEQISEILLTLSKLLGTYNYFESNEFFATVKNWPNIGEASNLFEFIIGFKGNGIDSIYLNHLRDQLLLKQKRKIEKETGIKNLILTQMQ